MGGSAVHSRPLRRCALGTPIEGSSILVKLAHQIALNNLHQHHPHNVEGWIIRETLFDLKTESVVKTIYQSQTSGTIVGTIIQVVFGSLQGCSKLDNVGCKAGMVGDDVHHGRRLCRIREIGDTIHPVCHKMIQQLALKQMEAGALGELGFKASAMGLKTLVFVSWTKLSGLLIAMCRL